MEINQKTIGDLMGMGKELMDLAGMGKNLSTEDIEKKPVHQMGIGASSFSELGDLGKKLSAMSKLVDTLGQLGISKEMIDKALKMAPMLIAIGSKGKAAVEEKTDSSLSDIGLDKNMFNDLGKMGESLGDISGLGKLLEGQDSNKVMDGINSVLNMFKK